MKAVQTFTNETAFLTALGTGSTLINFDTDPTNTPIPSNTVIDLQYLPVGVDFNPFNGGNPQAIHRADNFAYSPPNVLETAAQGGGFEAIFTLPVSGVGLQVGDLQDLSFGTTLFEIFDASNTSLASFNLFNELGNGATMFLFFGVTSNTPIAKLQLPFENLVPTRNPAPRGSSVHSPGPFQASPADRIEDVPIRSSRNADERMGEEGRPTGYYEAV